MIIASDSQVPQRIIGVQRGVSCADLLLAVERLTGENGGTENSRSLALQEICCRRNVDSVGAQPARVCY